MSETLSEQWVKALMELKEVRAEIEQLRQQVVDLHTARRQRIEEIERLTKERLAAVSYYEASDRLNIKLVKENDRLRAALQDLILWIEDMSQPGGERALRNAREALLLSGITPENLHSEIDFGPPGAPHPRPALPLFMSR